jgi:16S rRNA processing protein RimM
VADAAWPEDALEVGRVVDAWGVKGWFRVQPYAADGAALLASRRWHLRPADAGARPPAPPLPSQLEIVDARPHGEGLVASARGVLDRSGAEALRGARLFIGRASFPKPGEDEFYWADLIGLTVVNRGGEALGTVAGLIDNGPQSVLRVRPGAPGGAGGPDAGERLIPFVSAYVDKVDLPTGRITVDWGLDY